MRFSGPTAALSCAMAASACAIMPELPPDWALPMEEILLHTSCELQSALRDIDARIKPSHFNARNWKISITLNPKMDADIQPGAGLTRKVPPIGPRIATWILGTGNGVTLDMKGQRTGSVDFTFDSEKLIADDGLPCDRATPSYHSLTKYLGIKDWLYRSVEASAVAASAIENPKFSADVFIKFSGTGTYTYTFPPGANLASLGGYDQLDEALNINFTAKPKVVEKFSVVSLPKGGKYFDPNNGHHTIQSTVTLFEDQQLSLQQIRQQLQNLRTGVTQ
jgi:hypothetical protein